MGCFENEEWAEGSLTLPILNLPVLENRKPRTALPSSSEGQSAVGVGLWSGGQDAKALLAACNNPGVSED